MKFFNIFYCLMAICVGTFFPFQANANITLDKVIVKFDPASRPVANVVVTNKSDAPVKVTTEIVEAFNSGTDDESEEKTKEIVVAPKGFELDAHESRAIRLVLRKIPEDQEKIYRIRFIPSEISFTKEVDAGDKSVRVGVIMSMGLLVMAAPKNPEPKLDFERTDNKIIFTNNGNVTAQLQREDFCNKDRTECVPLLGKRVYPGAKWVMDIPEQLIKVPFSQTVLINGDYSTITYPVTSP